MFTYVVRAAPGVWLATDLAQQRLTAIGMQVGGAIGELLAVVNNTVTVSGVVAVKVLVDIIDELRSGAVGILDTRERRSGCADEGCYMGPVGARQEDQLGCGAGSADGIDGRLQNVCSFVDV